MEFREIECVLEGILFSSGEPVPLERLCVVLELDRKTVESILQRLSDYYAFERRGIRLLCLDSAYQLCSAPEYADSIRRCLDMRRTPALSQAAVEVLSIIAYYQPVTRAYIDSVRGVDSSYTVGMLTERGLLEPCGRLDAPGRPTLYRTSETFLRVMGISALEELPELPNPESVDGMEQIQAAIDELTMKSENEQLEIEMMAE